MTRQSRTRTASRVIATVVVVAILIGAYIEYRRTRRSAAAKSPAPQAVAPATRPVGGPPTGLAAGPSGGIPPMLASTPQPPPVAAPVAAPATASAAKVIADAKLKQNAGDLVAARGMLNDALLAGNLGDADVAAVKKQIAELNTVLLFSGRVFAGDTLVQMVPIKPGDRLAKIASDCGVPFDLLMQVNHIVDPKKLKAGQSLKVIHGPINAVVNKSKFTLDLYLNGTGGPGSTFVASYPVGLGEKDSTPTGTWEIKNKLKDPVHYGTRGEGVVAAGDPKNPLGPYWLGLEGTEGNAVGNDHYGIHGTIDPSSIGKMASLGCIRLHNEDVAVVYNLLVEKKSKVKVEN